MTTLNDHGDIMTITTMPAGEFKAKCLHVMDDVNKKKQPIIVTKRGKPVAKIMPILADRKSVFGCMKGTATIKGDITKPIDVKWDANE